MVEEMRNQIKHELEKYYEYYFNRDNNSGKVIEEYLNRISGYVKFPNGTIYLFLKKGILEKYVSYPPETFIAINMRHFNQLSNLFTKKCYFYKLYPSKLVRIAFFETSNQDRLEEITLLDKILLQRELEIQKNEMMKRLETYLKERNGKEGN